MRSPSLLFPYEAKTKPHKHQRDALALHLQHPKAFALLAEMGTGKSKIILDEFGLREACGDLHDLLIVAPAGSYRNWDEDKTEAQPSQFKAHLSDDLFKRLRHAAWVSGGSAADKLKLKELLACNDAPRALLVNVEALSSVVAAREACRTFLSAPGRRSMMIVDESTVIKNWKAQRTKCVQALGRLADSRRILTGLVTPRSPLDLYSQFEFLNWSIIGFQHYTTFRARYAVMQETMFGGRLVKLVVGYKNTDELRRKIAPYSFRVLKEDCLDLPPKVYQIREVKMTAEQQRMYDELKRFATTHIADGGHVTATAVITQIIRLHQLCCGHVVDEAGNIRDVSNNRIAELMDLLDEHAGKAIIWCKYHHSIERVAAALRAEYGEDSVALYYGGNQSTRGADEKRFLGLDPHCRFMVATPAAGGLGNTWVNASLVIYFANDENLGLRMQSEDRSHREGLKHAVTYVDLLIRNTVDEKIIKALRSKINLATVINGENYREWLI